MADAQATAAAVPPSDEKRDDKDGKSADRLPHVGTIPYNFAAVAGLAYAVGFLVEFTFMNSIGAKDSLTEPFKAKHIYIGILCLLFPASVITIILAAARMRQSVRDATSVADKLRYRMYAPNAALYIIFLFAFYGLIGIARPNTFSEHEKAFAVLFGLALLGPILVHLFHMRIADLIESPTPSAAEDKDEAVRIAVKATIARALIASHFQVGTLWAMAGLAFCLTVYVFSGLRHDIWEMLGEGGYLHFGLLGLSGFLLWRFDVFRQRREKVVPQAITPGYLMVVTLVMALSYLSVIFFAGRVYCYIPVYKGGGDFSTESPAIIQFDPRITNSLPTELLDVGCQSKPVFIIQQNSAAFFLAIPNATNNPTTWRRVGHTNKPSRIFVVRRDVVLTYQFEQSH
ncbi:MAG: hypothetical protein ACLQU4_08230 [Limisphaerales bacterium]